MNNKLIFLLLLLSALYSCSENTVTIPEDIVQQKKMTEILTDIHLAQAAINIKSEADTTSYSMNDYVSFILSKHGVSNAVFFKSLKFYSNNPEILDQVYDSVITGLSRMEGEELK